MTVVVVALQAAAVDVVVLQAVVVVAAAVVVVVAAAVDVVGDERTVYQLGRQVEAAKSVVPAEAVMGTARQESCPSPTCSRRED